MELFEYSGGCLPNPSSLGFLISSWCAWLLGSGKFEWFWVVDKTLAYRNSDQNSGEQGLPVSLSAHQSHGNNGGPPVLTSCFSSSGFRAHCHVKSSFTALCADLDREADFAGSPQGVTRLAPCLPHHAAPGRVSPACATRASGWGFCGEAVGRIGNRGRDSAQNPLLVRLEQKRKEL